MYDTGSNNDIILAYHYSCPLICSVGYISYECFYSPLWQVVVLATGQAGPAPGYESTWNPLCAGDKQDGHQEEHAGDPVVQLVHLKADWSNDWNWIASGWLWPSFPEWPRSSCPPWRWACAPQWSWTAPPSPPSCLLSMSVSPLINQLPLFWLDITCTKICLRDERAEVVRFSCWEAFFPRFLPLKFSKGK